MAASGVVTDCLTAEQIKRAYDLGFQEGVKSKVIGHTSAHTAKVDAQLAYIKGEYAKLHKKHARLDRQNRLLRIICAACAVVVLYFLMKGWAA